MKSWKLVTVLLLTSCASDRPEPQTRERERPVRVSDAEVAKMLSGVTPAEPRLCNENTCRDPELFVDLDAFIRAEKDGQPAVGIKQP